MKIEEVELVAGSLVATALDRVHYADVFRIRADRFRDVDEMARALFGSSPGWIRGLMKMRDAVVRLFGLKTSDVPHQTVDLRTGSRVGIFRILQRTDDEILMGEDDRHLDFRVSVISQSSPGARWMLLSTVVRYNHWGGRLYFFLVRPFHRIIVKSLLGRV